MKTNGQIKLKVVTYNLGGGTKRYRGSLEAIPMEQLQAMIKLISGLDADLLCLQEVAQYIDADGKLHSMMDTIQQAGNFPAHLYGETLSMKKNMQVKKDTMVDGLFMDWWDWSKGNAVFSKTSFSRLGNTAKEGVPRNVPIFQPKVYEGTRDSDPRYAILGRIKRAPFPYFVNLHLTTLVGERPPNVGKDVFDAAKLTRRQQLGRILDLVQRNILDKEEPIVLMGDFNAIPEEYNIKEYLERQCGFIRLVPNNPSATHSKAGMVDHIFFSPAGRLVDYDCWIENSKLAHQVSDHLPVIAEMTIK